jgi:hypothetical protein
MAAVTVLTKSGAASETTGGRFGLAGIYLLQRHFKQRFARQRQRLPVAFNQLLTFAAVAFCNRALQLCQRAVARQDPGQMEEGHLHNGVDTRGQAHSRAIFAALMT